jgi:predicted lipoprotein with Yx(FWY)xxD motif/plastocyanin
VNRLVALIALAAMLMSGASAFATGSSGTPEAQAEPTVYVRQDPELGPYLTDRNGMTLYLFTNDTEPGVSTCYDKCAENWPIFTAEEPLSLPLAVEGELTLITRDDGTSQVAYNGIPLYYWKNDVNPGDTTGQGVGDVWFIVAPGQQFGGAAPVASPGPGAMGTPAVAGDVQITLMEFAIVSSEMTFKVGETYTFNITNEGEFTHEFVIGVNGAYDEPIKADGKEIEVENIASGASASLEFTFTEPGTYQFACFIGQHYQNGMALTVEVVE